MAFLNTQERENLQNDLKGMKFNQAKGKVRGMDPKSRIVFLRNVQNVNQWITRYDLPTLGARVLLIEEKLDQADGRRAGWFREAFTLVDVKVEPMPENRT